MPPAKNNTASTIVITSLEQDIRDDVRAHTASSLAQLNISQLLEPTVFLLHQLITNTIELLHFNVFRQIIQSNFDLGDDINLESEFKAMYDSEISEHGDKNIAKFCQENNLDISLSFPSRDNIVAVISAPVFCTDALRLSDKLIDTLGYQLTLQPGLERPDTLSGTIISYRTEHDTIRQPTFLSPTDEIASAHQIFEQLCYGTICFNKLGVIQSLSPALLSQLNLETNDAAVAVFSSAIPAHFYNDVIWGIVLNEQHGKFENYRVRIAINDDRESSVLFNVSGFCDDNAIIHTLWQTISVDGKNSSTLSEGSILNEVRIHNITRNYVPQLVEQKAREVVRMGGNLLSNEECNIAILFCDIVGFTTYVEKNENEESIIHTLNSILRRISLSVKKHGGFIDKFMGDCIMVLFRNPFEAVLAALEMQRHSTDINLLRKRANLDMLLLRIGIHWGKVVIGNVGTPERLDWTTIGDVVNTASRIEKSCRPEHVLISQDVRDAIEFSPKMFHYGETFNIALKGKKNALSVCYVYPVD